MEQTLEIVVMNGPKAGERFSVPQSGLRLGRASSNDVAIKDEELSRNHCMFEALSDGAVQVIDLASANGTYVNGTMLEGEPKKLSRGDEITAGATRFKVVNKGEAVQPEQAAEAGAAKDASGALPDVVDLGLGMGDAARAASGETPAAATPGSKRASLVNMIWAGVILVFALAIGVILCVPSPDDGAKTAKRHSDVADETKPQLRTLLYEKVEADANRIFRFAMTIDENGVLRVVQDDVPQEDRHVDKSTTLSEEAVEEIAGLFSSSGWEEGDGVYLGASAESENSLKRWRIKTVIGERVRETLVENEVEPEFFQDTRTSLEAFAKNELHVTSLNYSKDELVRLAGESEKIGDARHDEAEVEYGNLASALKAYNEAAELLDTVNPKPPFYPGLVEKQRKTRKELDEKINEQAFLADKAIHLGDWENAAGQLRILIDIVNNRNDERSIKAKKQLVDVEERMKKKRGGKKK